jgi:hypothetical protein
LSVLCIAGFTAWRMLARRRGTPEDDEDAEAMGAA